VCALGGDGCRNLKTRFRKPHEARLLQSRPAGEVASKMVCAPLAGDTDTCPRKIEPLRIVWKKLEHDGLSDRSHSTSMLGAGNGDQTDGTRSKQHAHDNGPFHVGCQLVHTCSQYANELHNAHNYRESRRVRSRQRLWACCTVRRTHTTNPIRSTVASTQSL
jgi:hypothetical protein